MKVKINNIKELKSLQLYSKIKKFNSFLNDKNTCGIFITSAELHPKIRIEAAEQFLNNNLKVTKISARLIKILLKFNNQDTLENLLTGPVYLIEAKQDLLIKNNLDLILSFKKFKFRFLYYKQQIYRSEEVLTLIQNLNKNIYNNSLITLKLNKILLF